MKKCDIWMQQLFTFCSQFKVGRPIQYVQVYDYGSNLGRKSTLTTGLVHYISSKYYRVWCCFTRSVKRKALNSLKCEQALRDEHMYIIWASVICTCRHILQFTHHNLPDWKSIFEVFLNKNTRQPDLLSHVLILAWCYCKITGLGPVV